MFPVEATDKLNGIKKFFTILSLVLFASSAIAALRLPRIFGDGMVLQRQQLIPVWGWAQPGEKIQIHFHGQQKTTVAGADGKWMVRLDPEEAGGPFRLEVSGTSRLVMEDVWVGDVWICSGQSNMEFPVAGVQDAKNEIDKANYPMIRQFKVPVSTSLQPLEDLEEGGWRVCNPSQVAGFTGVGYFFGRALFQNLGTPIGLVNASCGGTIIETWISKPAFEESAFYKEMIQQLPQMTVADINARSLQNLMEKIGSTQEGLPDEQEKSAWMKRDYDDSRWPLMKLPGLWEARGWPTLDGKVEFRKEWIIRDSLETGKAVLQLGPVDDNDEVWVNGIKVGATRGHLQQPRIYPIPGGILRVGKNVVAVKVEDVIGGGGFTGKPDELKVESAVFAFPLAGQWRYRIESVATTGFAVYPNDYPTLLFNGMINPIKTFPIKGVIWYQGESNTSRAYEYRTTFPLLISDWRYQWKQGDFPFLFVQLASFEAHTGNAGGSEWAELREAQTMTLRVPHTGMSITTDIGNPLDIHPKNKQEVGKRLAAIALNKVYGKGNPFSGPTFQSMEIVNHEVHLSFSNVEGGLMVKNKSKKISGFFIAGADRKFYPARAFEKGNDIVVLSDSVPFPVAVRYAWSDSPDDANVFNAAGFPLGPFRTDDWPTLTREEKYIIRQTR